MSRDAAPQFRSMPGSAILTMVLLGFVAIMSFAGGNALMELTVPVGSIVLIVGFVDMALAIGIGGRKRWAAAGTPIWCGLMIVGLSILSIERESADPGPISGMLGFYVLVGIFATRKNTLAWCHISAADRSGNLSIDREPDDEISDYRDWVELIGNLDEYGLRDGSVGTIVGMNEDPTSFEVDFVDGRNETTTRVTLRPDQLRFIPDPR